jgi:hypothetical protein
MSVFPSATPGAPDLSTTPSSRESLDVRVTALEQQASSEAAARAAAEETITGAIATEAQTRVDGDQANAEAIAAEQAARVVAVQAVDDRIGDEIMVRADADEALSDRIGGVESAISGFDGRADTLEAAVQAVDGRIDGEITARADADTALSDRIGAAESAISGLDGRADTLEAADTAEAAARAAGDATNAGAIASETAARVAGDAANAGAIGVEQAARISGDTVLHGRIDGEIAARTAAITGLGEDIAALGQEVDAAVATVDQEQARAQAAELQLSSQIDANAASTTTQMNIDRAARIQGDQVNADAISAEAAARVAGDSANTAGILAEQASRITGDNQLHARIDGEIAAREDAIDGIEQEIAAVQVTDTTHDARISQLEAHQADWLDTVDFGAYVADLPVASPNDVASAGDAMIVIGGVPKRFTVNLFASRKTADLNPLVQLLGNEWIPSFQESTGLEGKIALNAIMRMTTGVINPKLPPYNCKGDLRETKLASCSSGSNIITCSEGMFVPGDVGKLCYLSNAGPSFSILETTIIGYISSTQVTIATNASVSKPDNQMFWGTDDTAGMQLALNDIAAPGKWTYGGCVAIPPGMYLVGPLTYKAKTCIFGYGRRQSVLCRKPTSSTNPILRNFDNQVDFPVIQGLGIYGMQYVQRVGFGSRGIEFISVLPGSAQDTLPQVDPYPFFKDLAIFGCAWDGLYTYYRNSGDLVSIDLYENWGNGWLSNSYDINVMNMLAIANRSAGVNLDSNGSANCNINNLKASYNGAGPGSDTQEEACNLLVAGFGHNITNARCQESFGCNVVIKGGYNKFGDLSCDDTACIKPAHGSGPSYSTTLANIRADILFLGPVCVGNFINDAACGRSVHGVSYQCQTAFMSGNASSNRGRIVTRPGTTYGGYLPGSGPYAPGPTGTDSSGGWGATNHIYLNDTLI